MMLRDWTSTSNGTIKTTGYCTVRCLNGFPYLGGVTLVILKQNFTGEDKFTSECQQLRFRHGATGRTHYNKILLDKAWVSFKNG
jgi:hypothetical protein